MIRIHSLAAVVLLGMAAASPALALSVTSTPANTAAGAKLVDPDEALSGAFKNLVGSAEATVRETPTLHGAPVTYDLSKDAKTSNGRDAFADLARNPSDPSLNPFMGGASDQDRPPHEH